ncbi:MAG TPA: hypothetical protein VMI73_11810 [Trebonia sp.]|nr:hypothetical protein [Trebonia sp.]
MNAATSSPASRASWVFAMTSRTRATGVVLSASRDMVAAASSV